MPALLVEIIKIIILIYNNQKYKFQKFIKKIIKHYID